MLTPSACINLLVGTVLIILVSLFPESVRAQQLTGDLQFKVVDSLGNPIPGVNATVTGPHIQRIRGSVSDDDGYVNILSLQPGVGSVKISHGAYQPITYENVLIQLGKTTSLGTVTLRGTTHELPEVVIASIRSPLIDPGTTNSAESMRATEFEGLPVDRNYRSIVSLLPLANASYYDYDEVNIGGATGMENRYFVDGVDVTESFLGNTGTNLPYNFVNEIEVKEGGYEAEYASALGGIVNVITPSGSNELQGSAFGFYTSNRFAANKQKGLNDPAQGGFSNYDAGVGVGGALVQDALWFYAAYNPKVETRDVDLPGFGTHIDKTTIHSFAGKITWSASPELKLMVMTTGDPTQWHEVSQALVAPKNPDPYLDDQQHGGVNFSLRGTYATEGGLLLDASVSRATEKGVWQGATERGRNEILYVDEETGVASGGFGFFVDRFIYSNTYNLNGTLVSGSHTLKAGAQYRVCAVDENDGGRKLFRYSDSLYELAEDRALMTVGDRIPSLYVQDTWRISEKIRLHVGLRWDNQYIIGSDGTVGQRFENEFQPRAGLNFVPDGSQKFFASFGRYYQELASVMGESYTDGRYVRSVFFNHDPRVDPSGGDTSLYYSAVRPEVSGLKGQYFDEFRVGYERLLGENLKVSLQGIYRTLREAVGYGFLEPENQYVFGNPGSGAMDRFPKAQRDYTALALTLQGQVGDNCSILASYVLSRNYGNYPGLYDAYNHLVSPNDFVPFGYNVDPSIPTGLLPNDRTHVFKVSASYRFGFGLVAGTSFFAETGTPLNEMAGGWEFLRVRGTAGRTPAIWDLNFRFMYDVPLLERGKTRLILDIFHVLSQQKPVDIVQQRLYLDGAGNVIGSNPFYGLAIKYQPAMSARVGMEVRF